MPEFESEQTFWGDFSPDGAQRAVDAGDGGRKEAEGYADGRTVERAERGRRSGTEAGTDREAEAGRERTATDGRDYRCKDAEALNGWRF